MLPQGAFLYFSSMNYKYDVLGSYLYHLSDSLNKISSVSDTYCIWYSTCVNVE